MTRPYMDKEFSMRQLVLLVAFFLMCATAIMVTLDAMDQQAEAQKWFKKSIQCIDARIEDAKRR